MFPAVETLKKSLRLASLSALFVLVGCASSGKQPSDTEAAYYETAQKYLENRNYSMAVERLTELKNRFPLGRYTKASTLDLMYAQYQMNDFTSSLIEADRFLRLNPDHPNNDYAAYVRAMSYYRLFLTNRGVFGKGDPAMRSPEQGEKAFQALSNYIQTFPGSEYRPEALEAMVVLKDALARHELIVADYYIRRDAWIAAAERAQIVIEHYPGVSAVGDAYVVLIESYRSLGLTEDMHVALATLKAEYPNHPSLDSGEYEAPNWEEDRWWVKVITLGLTS